MTERTFSRVIRQLCDLAQSSKTLEMIIFAPMKVIPSHGATGMLRRKISMISLIARWGHNVLLVGSSFLVIALLSVVTR